MLDKFLSLAKQQVNKSIYVWGAQGELLKDMNKEWIKRKETSTSNYERAVAMYEKRKNISGARAFDCSGLVCWCLTESGAEKQGFDKTARGLFSDCCDKITKSQLRDGDLCFKYSSSKGYISHVGIYCGGKIIEAKGRDYGVVETSYASSWNYFGRLKVFENEQPKEVVTIKRLLKKGCKGDDVKAVQQLLISLNYNLPKFGADGDFGRETDGRVRTFQIDHKLTVDGIVGKNTITAMGGKWQG